MLNFCSRIQICTFINIGSNVFINKICDYFITKFIKILIQKRKLKDKIFIIPSIYTNFNAKKSYLKKLNSIQLIFLKRERNYLRILCPNNCVSVLVNQKLVKFVFKKTNLVKLLKIKINVKNVFHKPVEFQISNYFSKSTKKCINI